MTTRKAARSGMPKTKGKQRAIITCRQPRWRGTPIIRRNPARTLSCEVHVCKRLVVLIFVVLLSSPLSMLAQSAEQRTAGTRVPTSPEMRRAMRAAAKMRNAQRQKDLEADTAKLLRLATELKQYVDET